MVTAQESSSYPTILSAKEAVQAAGKYFCDLIFEKGGFEEIAAGSGMGVLLKGAKPILKRKVYESIEAMTDEQGLWIVDQIHSVSSRLEDLTGQVSPYHYDTEVSEVSE